MLKETRSFLYLFISLMILSSCTMFDDKLMLKKADFSDIDGWHDDDQGAALQSFLKSCQKITTIPEGRNFHSSGLGGKHEKWQKLCAKAESFKDTGGNMARAFFETYFNPYLATNWGRDEGIFTGYYEIELEGSYKKHGQYQFPIYAKPTDLQAGRKYYSREQIESGKLRGRGLEIAWVNDPVRLFFLHVQGSGRIKMDDGSILRVGYNGKNNHNYRSIGGYMIEKGYLEREEVTAQSIKKWLYSNPSKMEQVLSQNPSYVFFRKLGAEGPIGGQGVALTPMRSLAVDKRFVPYGAPVWVDVALNGRDNEPDNSFKKLLVAQDTGSAIKGPVRGDLFFGYGDEAEKLAGHQNSKGRYYILLPSEFML